MGKWVKPDPFDLANALLNNSIRSISWQLINIIPKKLYTKYIKQSYQTIFEKIVEKYPNLIFFGPFRPWQITVRAIEINQTDSWYITSPGSFIPKKIKEEEKCITQFLRNQVFRWKVYRQPDNGRTMDRSGLEKLRCLSAGGAKIQIIT